MQELVQRVAKETGISHELATIAVRITLDFLKQTLPTPRGTQIDAAIRRSAASADVRTSLEESMAHRQTVLGKGA